MRIISRRKNNNITEKQRKETRNFMRDICCIFNQKTHWHILPYYKERGDAIVLDSYYDTFRVCPCTIYKLIPKKIFSMKLIRGNYGKLYLQHSKGCRYNNNTYDSLLSENGLGINIVSVCNVYDCIDLSPEDQEFILENKLKLINKNLSDCTKITFGKLKGYYIEMLPIYADTCNRILGDVIYDSYIKDGIEKSIYKDPEEFTEAIFNSSPIDLIKNMTATKKYFEWVLMNVDFVTKEDRVKIRNIVKLFDNLRKTKHFYSCEDYSDSYGLSDYDDDLVDAYSMVMYDGCGGCI